VSGLVILVAALPIAAALVGALVAGGAYAFLAEELDAGLIEVEHLRDRETFQSVRIYDRNGILLREVFNEGRRTQVDLSTLPRHVLQATIAVEDASFYTNPGVDPFALARAVGQAVLEGEVVSGASTITQQYVRHFAFSNEERLARSMQRKLKEMVLALVMTQRYSKDEILEGYINEIYYGNLAYGIEAASHTIFDKTAAELTLAEAAMLAGLPQSPYNYDPLDPDQDVQKMVRRRQETVLALMAKSGYITQAEARTAAAEELVYRDIEKDTFLAPHFVVYVMELLEEELGPERMARGGLDIETTLDFPLQSEAEGIVRERVDAARERHNLSSASVVAMEPRTGQILAMVGSKDYWDDSIDGRVNVSVRQRQPGSSIKPLTYATALEEGIPPWSMVWDVPMERSTPQGLYTPVNYDGVFHGPVRLREALANSYNIPALKVLERVGVRDMIVTANRMGISSLDPDSDRYGLSLTLGGGEVTLLDLTTAFSTFANGGGLIRPNPILRITDSDGGVLYQRAADRDSFEPAPAIDPTTAYIITDWLSDNAARAPAFGTSSP
jgi:membrane peptidoglycan carboxypeptidase